MSQGPEEPRVDPFVDPADRDVRHLLRAHAGVSFHGGPGYMLIEEDDLKLSLKAGPGTRKEWGSDNDSWVFDLATNTWTQLALTTDGVGMADLQVETPPDTPLEANRRAVISFE